MPSRRPCLRGPDRIAPAGADAADLRRVEYVNSSDTVNPFSNPNFRFLGTARFENPIFREVDSSPLGSDAPSSSLRRLALVLGVGAALPIPGYRTIYRTKRKWVPQRLSPRNLKWVHHTKAPCLTRGAADLRCAAAGDLESRWAHGEETLTTDTSHATQVPDADKTGSTLGDASRPNAPTEPPVGQRSSADEKGDVSSGLKGDQFHRNKR